MYDLFGGHFLTNGFCWGFFLSDMLTEIHKFTSSSIEKWSKEGGSECDIYAAEDTYNVNWWSYIVPIFNIVIV